jgi:hypothetical protein
VFLLLEVIKTNMKLKNKVLGKLVKQINKGGVTYSPLLHKDYGGTKYLAVSPFPERSQIFTGRATGKMIAGYCYKNNDLIEKGFSLGAWFNGNDGKTYLDVVTTVSVEKQTEAITLGKHSNQIAGFNLSDFTEIPLGGTGEFDDSLVSPFEERLSEALTLMSN